MSVFLSADDGYRDNAHEPDLGAAAINFGSVSKDDERDPRSHNRPAGSNHGRVDDRSVARQSPSARLRNGSGQPFPRP